MIFSVPKGIGLPVGRLFESPMVDPSRHPFAEMAYQALTPAKVECTGGASVDWSARDLQCDNTCESAFSGTCDDATTCAIGTDCRDCQPRPWP